MPLAPRFHPAHLTPPQPWPDLLDPYHPHLAGAARTVCDDPASIVSFDVAAVKQLLDWLPNPVLLAAACADARSTIAGKVSYIGLGEHLARFTPAQYRNTLHVLRRPVDDVVDMLLGDEGTWCPLPVIDWLRELPEDLHTSIRCRMIQQSGDRFAVACALVAGEPVTAVPPTDIAHRQWTASALEIAERLTGRPVPLSTEVATALLGTRYADLLRAAVTADVLDDEVIAAAFVKAGSELQLAMMDGVMRQDLAERLASVWKIRSGPGGWGWSRKAPARLLQRFPGISAGGRIRLLRGFDVDDLIDVAGRHPNFTKVGWRPGEMHAVLDDLFAGTPVAERRLGLAPYRSRLSATDLTRWALQAHASFYHSSGRTPIREIAEHLLGSATVDAKVVMGAPQSLLGAAAREHVDAVCITVEQRRVFTLMLEHWKGPVAPLAAAAVQVTKVCTTEASLEVFAQMLPDWDAAAQELADTAVLLAA